MINEKSKLRRISKLRDRTNWQENVLSMMNNYNYYIKFFMTDMTTQANYLREGYKAFLRNDANIFTIAETATTAFNLDNLEIIGLVSPNPVTGFSTATNFSFTIKEQGGLSLVDRIILAAKELGLRNWIRIPYFLVIEFKGYDENGNPSRIIENNMTHTRWIFRLVLQDIKVKLDAGGSVYEITAVTYNELAFADNYQSLSNSVTLKGSTVGEILDQFVKELEKQEIQNGKSRNLYRIKVLNFPEKFGDIIGNENLNPRKWKITSDPYKDQIRKEEPTEAVVKNITVPKGETLETLLKELFVNTEEGQKILLRNSFSNSMASDNKFDTAYFWLETKVSIREDNPYDIERGDYNREIEYIVVPQTNQFGIGTTKQLEPVIKKQKDKMIENLLEVLESGRLRKRYNYIFTGLNTEILDFDLRFDALYKAALPLYAGNQTTNLATTTVIEQKDNIITNSELGKLFGNVELGRRVERELDSLMKDPNNRSIFGLNTTDFERRTNVNMQNFQKQEEGRVRKVKKISIEDISLANIESLDADIPINVDTSKRFDPTENERLVETINPRGKSFSVALLEQIYGQNLIEINLTIRGDPYWLGTPRDIPPINGFEEWLNTNPEENKSLAIYSTGIENLLITFKVPSEIDENGNVVLKSKNVFNGVYAVVQVKHSFSGGNFTQTLFCRRNPFIDVNLLLGEIDETKREDEEYLQGLLDKKYIFPQRDFA